MAPPSKPPLSSPPDEPPPRDALLRDGSTSAKEFDLSAKLRKEKPGLVYVAVSIVMRKPPEVHERRE
jgi:hypothetical protein